MESIADSSTSVSNLIALPSLPDHPLAVVHPIAQTMYGHPHPTMHTHPLIIPQPTFSSGYGVPTKARKKRSDKKGTTTFLHNSFMICYCLYL
jgi:hypothetical protein